MSTLYHIRFVSCLELNLWHGQPCQILVLSSASGLGMGQCRVWNTAVLCPISGSSLGAAPGFGHIPTWSPEADPGTPWTQQWGLSHLHWAHTSWNCFTLQPSHNWNLDNFKPHLQNHDLPCQMHQAPMFAGIHAHVFQRPYVP